MDRPDTDIPLDILFTEILPKLPAKSLMRFKTVSKSFKSLISSSAFACLHRHHSLSSNNRILMVSGTNRTLYSYDLTFLSHLPTHPSSTFRWSQDDIRIVSSCNGFVLVKRITQFPFVLLNPSNRTYIDIPISADDLGGEYTGFGFDDLSDNYKIVFVSEEYNDIGEYTRLTLIYNVNSNSWKIVDRTSHSHVIHGNTSYTTGVLINHNLIHWTHLYMPGDGPPSKIICFDASTETWKDDVLLPNHNYDPTSKTCYRSLGALDGCLFTSFENEVDSSTDIWVMKEYGVQESWTKLLTVSYSINLHGGVVPVAYRGGDSSEVLLRQRSKSKQVWYNLIDNTMKDAHVHNFWDQQPCICHESLVTLPGAKLFGAFYESDEMPEDQLISFGLIGSDLNKR